MSIRKTIGGDRLGSGKKMKVDLKSYERSTHDTSRAFRTTMSAGTLVPFLSRPILPGSTWDIELDALVMTHPTIGPLLGSYKVQLDIFLCPMRCYIARLHNNESGLGMNMKNVHIPQMEVPAYIMTNTPGSNEQVNPSSLLKYLGIGGIGTAETPGLNKRQFNAIPLLAYYEIGKNYYCNQQEEVGYIVHTDAVVKPEKSATVIDKTWSYLLPENEEQDGWVIDSEFQMSWNYIATDESSINPDNLKIYIYYGSVINVYTAPQLFTTINKINNSGDSWTVICENPIPQPGGYLKIKWEDITAEGVEPKLVPFDIGAIDDMKTKILQHAYTSPLIVNELNELPYSSTLKTGNGATTAQNTQQGLMVKTYQNDMFNNWMNTEWIDGENGINEITAVKIEDGKLEIPSLIFAKKVFNMLNRIALSGGTYDDWLEVTYSHERVKRNESPAYMGGLIKELTFEEVVSQAEAEGQPLGTLAGRGSMTGKHKGGHITVKTDEPAYVIGIVSLTPRIDYSQGNEWDINLKTVDDLHKPEMDAIGFQDLITEQMDWRDTKIKADGSLLLKSAGKQPAWINYQTSVNRTYGNFANDEQMWMTLNRRYEFENGDITDLTSYIDPKKFNHIFADTRRDAQNFWVQIGMKITARQKMSAKVMPNL